MKKLCSILMLSVLITTACSSDDDSNNNNDNQANTIEFDISGDESGSKEGSAYIVTVDSANSYMISGNDGNSQETQTFSLVFYKSFASNPLSNPEPGTYPIATSTELLDTDGFWVVYTNTQDQVDYGTQNVQGTLTITSNSNNQLKGTFQFSAGSHNQTVGTINVTNGTFSAAID